MRLTILAFCLTLVCGAARAEQPRPPCAGPPNPVPAGLDQPAALAVWLPDDPGADWAVPDCLGWPEVKGAVTVAAAGRLRAGEGVDGLIDRLRRVSEFAGMRYWSVVRKAWRPVYDSIAPVTDASGDRERADFGRDELSAGAVLHFREDRADPLRAVVQRLRVEQLDADRLEVTVENVTPGRLALLTVVPDGGARTLLSLVRESEDVWVYYTLTRVVDVLPGLFDLPRASWANRAAAMFRWFAGIPTDQEPPPAP